MSRTADRPDTHARRTAGPGRMGTMIALAGLVLAVPGSLLAWSQLTGSDEGSSTTATTVATTRAIDTLDRTSLAPPSTSPPPSDDGAGFDVSDCTITVDHIGAEIHAEADRLSRVLRAVPSGDYRPLAATESTWAGRAELWFQIDVDGTVGWIADNTIIVRAKSGGCP